MGRFLEEGLTRSPFQWVGVQGGKREGDTHKHQGIHRRQKWKRCAVSFVGRSMRLHRSTIVPPTPSTCLVPFVVLTLYAHRSVKGSCRMPAGRNRWRAPVPRTSSWRRSSRSRGSPGNGKEWRKQSINGPWKRSVLAVRRSLRCLFEDRSRPVFVSTETNYAVRSVRSVYAVCTRPVQTGLCAK